MCDTDDCENCLSRKEDVCRDRRAVSCYPLSGAAFHRGEEHFWKPFSVYHVIKVYNTWLIEYFVSNIWLNNLKCTNYIFIVFFYVSWGSMDQGLKILSDSVSVFEKVWVFCCPRKNDYL